MYIILGVIPKDVQTNEDAKGSLSLKSHILGPYFCEAIEMIFEFESEYHQDYPSLYFVINIR